MKLLHRYINLHRCLFLVKDTITSTTFWTQGFKEGVRPIKIFSHHLDVTKFLTFKNYLTNYSYLILSECEFSGMSVSDYRQFFKVLHSTKNLRKHVKPLTAAVLPATKAEPTMEMCAVTTAKRLRHRIRIQNSRNESNSQTFDTKRQFDDSTLGCIDQSDDIDPNLVKRRRLRIELPSEDAPSAANICHDYSVDNDMLKFSTSMTAIDFGFQLLMKELLPSVKISRPQFLIRLQLRKEGFQNSPLDMFIRFLKINYPEFCTPGGLLLPVREFVAFHGIVESSGLRYTLSRDEFDIIRRLELENLLEKDARRK